MEERAHVDFGRRSDDYLEYRPGFPSSFYDRLDGFRALKASRILDVGTGPAVMALPLAERGAIVVGVDSSPRQIDAARRRMQAVGLQNRAEFHVASAEDTGMEAGRFDWVTAGQCWHWFDSARVMAEVRRVLKSDGLLVLGYFSYLPQHSPVARRTEELILQYNPTWTMADGSGMYPERIDELVWSGFELVEQFCYHHEQLFSHVAWRGRVRTCNGVGSGALSDDEVEAFDLHLQDILQKDFPVEPLLVIHRVWGVVVQNTMKT